MEASSHSGKTNLLGMNLPMLRDYFREIGEQPFRAQQLSKWIYHHGVRDYHQMSNLSVELRTKLAQRSELRLPEILSDSTAEDGTRKWLLSVWGKSAIEMVYIPTAGRGTLCISSQVGCTLNCSFCATGKQGFNRNLTAAEIVGQLWLAEFLLRTEKPSQRAISNVVLMGMGSQCITMRLS